MWTFGKRNYLIREEMGFSKIAFSIWNCWHPSCLYFFDQNLIKLFSANVFHQLINRYEADEVLYVSVFKYENDRYLNLPSILILEIFVLFFYIHQQVREFLNFSPFDFNSNTPLINNHPSSWLLLNFLHSASFSLLLAAIEM